jgi:hypothetical protein
MAIPDHTFPLPTAETSKLDEVTDKLRHQPAYDKFKDFVRTNPWPCLFLALALGAVAGKLLRKNNRIELQKQAAKLRKPCCE